MTDRTYHSDSPFKSIRGEQEARLRQWREREDRERQEHERCHRVIGALEAVWECINDFERAPGRMPDEACGTLADGLLRLGQVLHEEGLAHAIAGWVPPANTGVEGRVVQEGILYALSQQADHALLTQELLDTLPGMSSLAFLESVRDLQRHFCLALSSHTTQDAARLLTAGEVEVEQSQANGQVSPGTSACLTDWAFGLEHGVARPKWHVFKKHRGEWRQRELLQGLLGGTQPVLLKAFAAGGGFLGKREAFKLVGPSASASDYRKIMGIIKPELSRLRALLRRAVGCSNKRVDPLPWDGPNHGWRAAVEIGYALEIDGQHIGEGQGRLQFKTQEQLRDSERLDLG
jgi:hypothetical protein